MAKFLRMGVALIIYLLFVVMFLHSDPAALADAFIVPLFITGTVYLFGGLFLMFFSLDGSKTETRYEEHGYTILGYINDLTWMVARNGEDVPMRLDDLPYEQGPMNAVMYRRRYTREIVGNRIIDLLVHGDSTDWEYQSDRPYKVILNLRTYNEVIKNL